MKKAIIAVLLLSSSLALSQSSEFGIKGGLNYGSTGDITTFSDFITDFQINGEDRVGYHIGLYGRLELADLFVQPEVLYTKLTTEYNFGGVNGFQVGDYNFSKIDVPILVGVNILGPIDLKAGPSFQYIINSDFDGIDIDLRDPENSFTFGYQIGAGVSLGQLGFDIRYEGPLSNNDTLAVDTLSDPETNFTIDARPSQWILSISYAFGSSK